MPSDQSDQPTHPTGTRQRAFPRKSQSPTSQSPVWSARDRTSSWLPRVLEQRMRCIAPRLNQKPAPSLLRESGLHETSRIRYGLGSRPAVWNEFVALPRRRRPCCPSLHRPCSSWRSCVCVSATGWCPSRRSLQRQSHWKSFSA